MNKARYTLNAQIVFYSFAFMFVLWTCNHHKQRKNENFVSNSKKLDCMEYIFSIDDSLGTVRNYACEKIPLSQTIKDYENGLKKLPFNNCPDEFSDAFMKHLEAWSKMGIYTERYSYLRGEMHAIFDSIEKIDQGQFEQLLAEIWSTWGKVDTIYNTIKKNTLPQNLDP